MATKYYMTPKREIFNNHDISRDYKASGTKEDFGEYMNRYLAERKAKRIDPSVDDLIIEGYIGEAIALFREKTGLCTEHAKSRVYMLRDAMRAKINGKETWLVKSRI